MEIQKIILNTSILTGKRRKNTTFCRQIQINVMIQVCQVPFSAPVSFKISMQKAPFVLIQQIKNICFYLGGSRPKWGALVAYNMVYQSLNEPFCIVDSFIYSLICWPSNLSNNNWHLPKTNLFLKGRFKCIQISIRVIVVNILPINQWMSLMSKEGIIY